MIGFTLLEAGLKLPLWPNLRRGGVQIAARDPALIVPPTCRVMSISRGRPGASHRRGSVNVPWGARTLRHELSLVRPAEVSDGAPGAASFTSENCHPIVTLRTEHQLSELSRISLSKLLGTARSRDAMVDQRLRLIGVWNC